MANHTTVSVDKKDAQRIRRAQMMGGWKSTRAFMHALLSKDEKAWRCWEEASEMNNTRRLLDQLKQNGWVIVPSVWASRLNAMANSDKVKVTRKTIEKGVVEFTLS